MALRGSNKVAAAIALAVVTVAGCVSGGSAQRGLFPLDVELSSEPSGAKIIVRVMVEEHPGKLKILGLTPSVLTIPAPVTVVLHKRGFAPAMVDLGSARSVKLSLQPIGTDSVYQDIWREGTFQREAISFQDEELKRRAYISDNPKLLARVKEAIENSTLLQGMTMEQVLVVRGHPQGVISAEDSQRRQDKWLYGEKVLLFKDGKLSDWQE